MEIPWLEPFRSAIARAGGGPPIVSLATVDGNGDPQVRSVVCRRVDDSGDLWITSDARSAKHAQIARHPRVAMVAWFPASREQFRFTGCVEIVAAEERDRNELWVSLPPATRATFGWPSPGANRTQADEAFARVDDSPEPPDSFEVLRLAPDVVEHLALSLHPHRRRRWARERQWRVEELNP